VGGEGLQKISPERLAVPQGGGVDCIIGQLRATEVAIGISRGD
jgi:hypothetical protein